MKVTLSSVKQFSR